MLRLGLQNRVNAGIDEKETGDTILIHANYNEKLCVVDILKTIGNQYLPAIHALL